MLPSSGRLDIVFDVIRELLCLLAKGSLFRGMRLRICSKGGKYVQSTED